MDQAIQTANARMEFVMQDKESLRLYHMREMAMSDWSSGIQLAHDEGHAEGHAEGRVEGIEEGILLTAKNLLRKGFDVSVVSDVTDLDVTTVNRLRAEL